LLGGGDCGKEGGGALTATLRALADARTLEPSTRKRQLAFLTLGLHSILTGKLQ
jgi:hypothetical protein